MGGNLDNLFDINNLSVNSQFDFIKLRENCNQQDNFFSIHGDSPYEHSQFQCMYTSPLDYKTTNSKNNLSLMSINLQSINSKYSDLCELISSLKNNMSDPDIICVQELWQFPSNADFTIPGYHKLIYKLRRNNVQGGGVGIYIKSYLNFSVNSASSIFVDRIFESVVVDITVKNKKISVGSLYRPAVNHPELNTSQQFEQFIDLFNNLLSDLSDAGRDVFLLGDLNIDLLKCNSCSKTSQYIDTLFSYGFIQTITKPTTCTNTSATLIDHCITNFFTESHLSNILTCSLSDHFPFIYTIEMQNPHASPKANLTRDFSADNLNKFRDALNNISWNFVTVTDCPQEAYNLFSDFFSNLYELYFPLLSRRPNKNFNIIEPWCSTGILTSRRNKLKLGCLAAKNPIEINVTNFKNYRNLYNRVIKLAKKLYFEKELKRHQSNLKKTWSLLCMAIKRAPKNRNSNLSSLCINPLVTKTIFFDGFS